MTNVSKIQAMIDEATAYDGGIPKEKVLLWLHDLMAHMSTFDEMFPTHDTSEHGPAFDGQNPEQKKMGLMLGLNARDYYKWSQGFKELVGAPEDAIGVSWILYQGLGIEPHGGRKFWLGQVHALSEASGNNRGVLEKGVGRAKKARDEHQITIAEPHSITKFVKSVRWSATDTTSIQPSILRIA